ncbi:MAG: 50S ribosomal protein L1, partial [Dehalococcoidia bacterium]|nr:50S ribosomal protein L1 [Dehalococcoidia bacterium]
MVTKVGKKHREALTLVDRLAAYPPAEAIALAKKA